MRLAPTLLAAAFAAVAVAREWQGDDDWELEGDERKGHPVGQFGGDNSDGSKEASWWEKLQGKQPEHPKHGHHEHGQMHHARDAMIPEAVQTAHHHHAGKKQGEHHPGHKHGHKAHQHKGAHAGAHKGEHAHKGQETGKPWDKWGWFTGPGHDILPREAGEPLGMHEGFPEQQKGHKGAHGHHPGHKHKGEHHKAAGQWGAHPQNEHDSFHEGIGHHKPEGLASPHFARDAHRNKPGFLDLPKFDERDTDEVDPDNEFFDASDFDDDDFDDDDDEDDTPSLSARDVEEEADPNEVSGDEPYYDLGDDGDDDIMDGEITDSPDNDDDDEDMDEDALDNDDEDDEDDDDAEGGDEDDDEDDDDSGIEKLKRWAEVKKHG